MNRLILFKVRFLSFPLLNNLVFPISHDNLTHIEPCDVSIKTPTNYTTINGLISNQLGVPAAAEIELRAKWCVGLLGELPELVALIGKYSLNSGGSSSSE